MADERVGIEIDVTKQAQASERLRKVAKDVKAIQGASSSVRSELGKLNHTLGSGLQTATSTAVRAATSYQAAVLGGLAAGAVFLGVKTAAAFEQSEIAFGVLLKSADKAKVMISDLRTFAENSPFALKDVNTGAQRLLAMGFSAQEIMPMMKTLGNAASAGIVPLEEGLWRMTYALGQMKAAGRVQGDELRQLVEMGIGVRQALSKGFNIPMDELPKAIREGKLGADKAIPIIMASVNEGFGGMMDAQSKSWTGMWSRFKEVAQNNAGDIAGTLMEPFKPAFGRLLDRADEFGKKMSVKAKAFGASFAVHSADGGSTYDDLAAALDDTVGAGGKFKTFAADVKTFFTDAGDVWKNSLKPAIADLSTMLPGLEGPFSMLRATVGYMADHPDAAKIFFEGMAIAIVSWKVATLLSGVTTAFMTLTSAIKGAGGAMAFLNAMMYANPITIILFAIVALAAGLYLLQVKLGDNIDKWKMLAGSLLPPIALVNILESRFGTLSRTVLAVRNAIASLIEMAQRADVFGIWSAAGLGKPEAPKARTTGIPFQKFPGQAAGGVTTSGGMSWVGEKGPELLSLPTGAMVRPLEGDEGAIPAGGNTFVELKISAIDLLRGERVAEELMVALGGLVARR